jgi:hypothetical protein
VKRLILGSLIVGLIILNIILDKKTNQTIETHKNEKNVEINELIVNEYERSIDKNSIVVIGKENFWIDIDVNQETIETATNLSKGCNGDEWCEKDRFFKYITNLRYCANKKDQKSSNEVMTLMSGDCDEKSQALASLLLAKEYRAVLIYTKGHAFVGMHVKDVNKINANNTKIRIDDKDYYYAETTDQNAYIGADNKIRPKDFIGIYDINQKKLIPLKKAVFEKRG